MTEFEVIRRRLHETEYTWLITGVAGFIGSHLLEFLLSHDQKVVGLDNFATGSRKNLNEVCAGLPAEKQKLFRFIEGDIRRQEQCEEACSKVDFILHQAALGSVPRSVHDPLATHDVNATGFLNMLLAAKNNQVKRMIYASSSSVYGDSPLLPKMESHQGNPLSPYAVSKMANELYAGAFGLCYGLETIGLRYFNVFGPRQNPNGPYAAVIPLWLKALNDNESIYINGDGETSRDFCYVKNVIQANILAAFTEKEEALNTVYNVAVGEQTSLNELYQLLKELTGNETHQAMYRNFREGDIRHSLADISKASNLLGYLPSYTVTEGLAETVAWYKESE